MAKENQNDIIEKGNYDRMWKGRDADITTGDFVNLKTNVVMFIQTKCVLGKTAKRDTLKSANG